MSQPETPLTSNQRSFWVVERFENGKSAGYWNGASSRSFVSDIDTAVQFYRKQDAFWATRGWHWRDTQITEHVMLDSLPVETSAAEAHAHYQPQIDEQIAENNRLRRWLMEFGVHKPHCATKRRVSDPCDCGLMGAIRLAHGHTSAEETNAHCDGCGQDYIAARGHVCPAQKASAPRDGIPTVHAGGKNLDQIHDGHRADCERCGVQKTTAKSAIEAIEQDVRRIEQICDWYNLDPNEWLQDKVTQPSEETSATPHPGACTCPACAPSLWAAGIKGATQPPEKASACPKCEAVRKLGLTSCFEHKQPENEKGDV